MTSLLVIGDAVLDVDVAGHSARLSSDAPVPVVASGRTRVRPGGAGLAAVLAARDGADVCLVTGIGADVAGSRLRDLLRAEGVDVHDIGRDGDTVTKTRILAAGHPVVRLDDGDPGTPGELRPAESAHLTDGDAVLVADYGLGTADTDGVRALLRNRIERGRPVIWDPHPRGATPVPGCAAVTPNLREALDFTRGSDVGGPLDQACRAGAALAEQWRADDICITCGEHGAVLVGPASTPLTAAAPHASSGDPCGAGDRFASRLALAYADGRPPGSAVRHAVIAATSFVDAGGAGAVVDGPAWTAGTAGPALTSNGTSDAIDLAERTRDAGGTVVTTGGCFDLLHAGHVESLRAARGLGDALIVCLNSDASVRRLKGPQRPIVPVEDRAAVLAALSCVDAVAIFDDDSPARLLERLRPHVFVKGGDYRPSRLPEAAVLDAWGGRAVTVPLVAGHSTTAILQEVRHRAV